MHFKYAQCPCWMSEMSRYITAHTHSPMARADIPKWIRNGKHREKIWILYYTKCIAYNEIKCECEFIHGLSPFAGDCFQCIHNANLSRSSWNVQNNSIMYTHLAAMDSCWPCVLAATCIVLVKKYIIFSLNRKPALLAAQVVKVKRNRHKYANINWKCEMFAALSLSLFLFCPRIVYCLIAAKKLQTAKQCK